MHTGFSYYEILGLSESASADEIKTAYRAAMLKYHPDVSSAPNAQRLTEMLNDAYSVLSDPLQRQAYDRAVASGHPTPEAGEEPNEIWDFFACDQCHKVDVHVRYAAFFKVFSLIFYSQMNGVGGVLCPECRSKVAVSSALFSAFLGPWGFPWGIFYTIRSLFASIRGGEFPRQQNAQLLRHQGIAFLQRGFINEARTALTASLRFENNPQVANLLNDQIFSISTVFPGPGWLKGQTTTAFLSAIPIVLVVLLFTIMGANSATSRGSATTSSDSSQTAADTSATQQAQNAQLKTLFDKCSTASDDKQNARAAYDSCNAALKWLNNDVQSSTPGSADFQDYSLVVDNARLYKSVAAQRLGWTSESKALSAQSLADYKTIKTSGVTEKLRNTANDNYECLANNVCKK